jgi:glycosyltransferase involved in cell wall biosynthesis
MSTGGCPQVVAKKVEVLKDFYNVIVVEWECVAWSYVVQRNRVIKMLGNKFVSLSENKEYELFNLIEDYNPDYLMIEEFSETFIPTHILKRLYSKDRNYKIFETTHSSHSRPEQKKFLPDKFVFVSPFSAESFKDFGVPFDIIEYPIDDKEPNKILSQQQLGLDPEWKHIVNIGLFTPGKNQGYAFEIARLLEDQKIKFHFVGNQAGNFEDYWRPIMETKPDNCVVWGEREDVDTFLQASDIHLFTSNMELNPLSIKESLEYGIPTFIFNLHTYMNKYNDFENITFLTGDKLKDANLVLETLGLPKIEEKPLNIKIVHLLLDPTKQEDISDLNWNSTVEKQNLSIQCWETMEHKFTSYVQRYSVVNRTELPTDNCMDPNIINPSKEFKNEPPVLTYGHYGAYRAHTQGIKENFDADVDILIVAEGDSYTDLSPDDFYDKIIESYNLCKKIDGKIVSFAGPCYMTGGEWWNMTKDHGTFMEVPHFLMGTTYLIMNSERESILNKIDNTGWHSPDFWLAWNYNMKSKILVSKEKLVYQKEGYSVLDYLEKEIN